MFAVLLPDKVLQQAAGIAVLSCASRGEEHLKTPNKNAIILRRMSPAL